MPQIESLMKVTTTDLGISANGTFVGYTSPVISSNNNKAVTATLSISDIKPGREAFAGAVIGFKLERQDDAGNWHPFHSLIDPFKAIDYGDGKNGGIIPDQVISVGPNLTNASDRPIDVSDGVNIISRESQKKGNCPDKVRFVVVVHEKKFGTTGAFSEITFSIDYELEAD